MYVSYSKTTNFDNDEIPMYNSDNPQAYIFSGKRVHRGLYQTAKGFANQTSYEAPTSISRGDSLKGANINHGY